MILKRLKKINPNRNLSKSINLIFNQYWFFQKFLSIFLIIILKQKIPSFNNQQNKIMTLRCMSNARTIYRWSVTWRGNVYTSRPWRFFMWSHLGTPAFRYLMRFLRWWDFPFFGFGFPKCALVPWWMFNVEGWYMEVWGLNKKDVMNIRWDECGIW